MRLQDRDRRKLESLFSIDTRGLAVMRIGLAVLLLVQLLVLRDVPGDPPPWLVGALVAVAVVLLVGWRSRFTVIVCWALYSLPLRSAILGPEASVPLGSYLLNLMLFWAMFLPIGDSWSLDARRKQVVPSRFLSIGSAAALLQVGTIYFWSGVAKDVTEWIVDATALLSVLSHPDYASSAGAALTAYPGALSVASVATIALEVIGSILLFVPGKRLGNRRIALVAAFLLFHVGIAAFMDIGMFPYVMMVIWPIFLPSRFWDRLTGRTSSVRQVTWDRGRLVNGIAGAALLFVIGSNLISWLLYPERNGFAIAYQEVARAVLLFQRWFMFNLPSGL